MNSMYLIRTDYSSFHPLRKKDGFDVSPVEEITLDKATELENEWGKMWKKQNEQLVKETTAFILNECFQAKDKEGKEIYWIPLDADGYVGPLFKHYGIYGNISVPLPEVLIVRKKNELPFIYKDKLSSLIKLLKSDGPRMESPVREDGSILSVISDQKQWEALFEERYDLER